MKATIYISLDVLDNPSFHLIMKFFEHECIDVDLHQDFTKLMALSKGRVNPASGFVVVINNDVCYDIYDVIKSIERNGYKQI